MKVHMSIDIEAPLEKIWPYLVEPDKTMQWYPVLKKFDYTSEKREPDSTFYWEQEVRARPTRLILGPRNGWRTESSPTR